jgi:hypothetical protein
LPVLPVVKEFHFAVNILKSTNKIGYQVQLSIRIIQHERDIKLMELLINYLGTGKIYKDPRDPVVYLRIVKL